MTRGCRRRRKTGVAAIAVRAASAMAMALLGAAQFADEVGDRHDPLGARLEVAQLDVAVRELVAEDDREVRSLPARALQLAAELARRELRPDAEAGGPKLRGDAQAFGRGGRLGTHHDRQRLRWRDRLDSLLLEGEDDPV